MVRNQQRSRPWGLAAVGVTSSLLAEVKTLFSLGRADPWDKLGLLPLLSSTFLRSSSTEGSARCPLLAWTRVSVLLISSHACAHTDAWRWRRAVGITAQALPLRQIFH